MRKKRTGSQFFYPLTPVLAEIKVETTGALIKSKSQSADSSYICCYSFNKKTFLLILLIIQLLPLLSAICARFTIQSPQLPRFLANNAIIFPIFMVF